MKKSTMQWLSVAVAEEKYGVDEKEIVAAIVGGRLRAAKVGDAILLRSDWLDSWLESIATGGDEIEFR